MVAPARVSPPLKWYGGEHSLAPKIVGLMPKHLHYVEPYAGGLSVMLAKDPVGVSEVVNDLHGPLTGFWRVLQDAGAFARFQRIVQAIPFSEKEWQDSVNAVETDPVCQAAAFFTHCRHSLAGWMDSLAPLSQQAPAWTNAVDGLPLVSARLGRVAIRHRDALDVIRQEDDTDTLFYLDPTYLHETRAADDVHHHEMTPEQHAELLDTIRSCTGKVLLSGYPSDVYDRELKGWKRYEFEVANHAAGGKTKRQMPEVVWANFSSPTESKSQRPKK